MKKRLLIIIPSVVVVIIILLIITRQKKETGGGFFKSSESVFAVNTTRAVRGEINNYIELNGDVKSKVEVEIYPEIAGKLSSFVTRIGDPVVKGQVIAYVDPSRPGQDYALSPVKAPISGTITDLPLEIGATVNQTMVVGKIGRLEDLEITTNVAEKYISKIKNRLDTRIKVVAFPEQKFFGFVSQVSPVVNQDTRTLELKVEVSSANRNLLKPGMFAKVKIITDKKNNIVKLPSETMIQRYGEFSVFVVDRSLPENISGEDYKGVLKAFDERIADIKKDKKLKKDEQNAEIEVLNKKINFVKTLYTSIYDNDKKKDKKSDDKKNKDIRYTLKEEISDDSISNIEDCFNLINYYFYKVKQKKVTPGLIIDNKVEIVEGLLPEEEVVVSGQTLLEAGSKIRIIDEIKPLEVNDVIE